MKRIKISIIVIQVIKSTSLITITITNYIFHHGELEESVTKRLRKPRTTGNGNMAAKTGNAYISVVELW